MGFFDTLGSAGMLGLPGLAGAQGFGPFQPNPAEAGFRNLTAQLQAQAQGRGPSLVDQQYRTALEQGGAQQRSVAAGARPGQTAMAQRLASQGIGNMSAQLGTQALLARLEERQRAQQLYLQALMGQAGVPTMNDKILGAAQGAGQAAMMLSDRRRKEAIAPGGKDADALIRALRAKSYRYRDPADGEGQRLGIMAQDLERVPGGHAAVVNTPRGKQIDTAQLSGLLGAAVGRLGERLVALEQRKGAR